METDQYLRPTRFIDSNHPDVLEFTQKTIGTITDLHEKAKVLYLAVRDQILYDPYHLVLDESLISASQTLHRGRGYCIEKSLLLAAAGRAAGIPSRLGFSIVKNHLAADKFVEMLRTDKFVFHGYNEFLLEGKWVKCTPAFNRSLCEKFDTQPLEFDGYHDSVFQQYSADGQQYMEYLHEYGQFDDLPCELFFSEIRAYYPHLFENGKIAFVEHP
ncbi:MAG: transglutaminase-like domain-containing protein [Chitinophagales bacterium]